MHSDRSSLSTCVHHIYTQTLKIKNNFWIFLVASYLLFIYFLAPSAFLKIFSTFRNVTKNVSMFFFLYNFISNSVTRRVSVHKTICCSKKIFNVKRWEWVLVSSLGISIIATWQRCTGNYIYQNITLEQKKRGWMSLKYSIQHHQ